MVSYCRVLPVILFSTSLSSSLYAFRSSAFHHKQTISLGTKHFLSSSFNSRDYSGTIRTRARALCHASPVEIATFEESDFGSAWPYTANDFNRLDESPDTLFYAAPRFVTHIDDGAISSVLDHYRRILPKDGEILDLCSSWISHLPDEVEYKTVVGLGMNAQELEKNKRLTSYVTRDLNLDPKLPFEDNSFDAVVNVVSVDYLTRPREVFNEINRVLRPGGVACMTFSNRCFPTKAVGKWLQSDDIGRMEMVANYFHFSGPEGKGRGGWENIQALDIGGGSGDGGASGGGLFNMDISRLLQSFSPRDPMFAVQATKRKSLGADKEENGGEV